MSLFDIVRRTLKFLDDTTVAAQKECARPGGERVREGIKSGAQEGMRSLGAGLAAYAILRYGLGADEQTSAGAAAMVSGYGAYRGYMRHAKTRDDVQSLINILSPAVSYWRDYQHHRLGYAR